jgi:hypothetical protein
MKNRTCVLILLQLTARQATPKSSLVSGIHLKRNSAYLALPGTSRCTGFQRHKRSPLVWAIHPQRIHMAFTNKRPVHEK